MAALTGRTSDLLLFPYWGEPERAPPGQFNGCAVYLFIYIYIYPTSYVRRPHVIIYSTRAQSILVPRSKPLFPGLHLMETAHAVGMDYQEHPYREARLAVPISSLEVPSICDSADRSPT